MRGEAAAIWRHPICQREFLLQVEMRLQKDPLSNVFETSRSRAGGISKERSPWAEVCSCGNETGSFSGALAHSKAVFFFFNSFL